jgi:hypothetical protein
MSDCGRGTAVRLECFICGTCQRDLFYDEWGWVPEQMDGGELAAYDYNPPAIDDHDPDECRTLRNV